jgi:cold-inducible RNA-binding protein
MGSKIFVGGLSWDTDDHGLRAYFEECGTVDDAKVITDRDTGRSRGFGFVTFSSDDEAQTAISQMDGTTLDGRTLNVSEAQDRRGGGGGGRRGGGGGGGGGYGGGGGGGRW